MAKTIDNSTSALSYEGATDAEKALIEGIDASALTFGATVAGILDDSARILDYCKAAYEGMAGYDKPAVRRDTLAVVATASLAARKFPEDAARQKAAWRIPANRPDGASVSGSAIGQRAEAYGDVVRAGIAPTMANVKEAFRLTSTGGSKSYRDARDAAVTKGEDFVKATSDAMTRLLAANKVAKAEKVAKAAQAAQAAESVKFDADKGTFADVVFALEWAHANIARSTESERKALKVALAAVAADLAPAK